MSDRRRVTEGPNAPGNGGRPAPAGTVGRARDRRSGDGGAVLRYRRAAPAQPVRADHGGTAPAPAGLGEVR
ncbi:MAG: hypothetical protein AVDCRST_MAG49-4682 [uncultured Thermomicrobiales bacterium]|uniref:Uncharacterized protein n=1 Tax=uncultured Thermomicrobiales bacterium TaxID=1645740 RepID=A0A6J4VMZ9_9BACT|nr:MAG: hypothetical protein AVDCRST_MAG49-4682 [uncultured Thermomicrobiales bacterium]